MNQNNEFSDWVDKWLPEPSQNKTYEFIDGLRGMAILLVVACHLIYENRSSHEIITFLYRFVASGSNGVTIFFVLSGFLISLPFWRNKIQQKNEILPKGYVQRRFYKIYPPLLLSLLCLVPIYIAISGDSSYAKDALMHLSGLSLFLPVAGKLNPVMWSLIVEVQFYIILPILFVAFKRLSFKSTLITLSTLFLIPPFAFRYYNHLHGLEFKLHPLMMLRFPTRLDAFAPGILLSGLFTMGILGKKWAKFGYLGMILLLVSLSLSAYWKLNENLKESFLWTEMISAAFKITGFGLLCFIANPKCLGARIFSISWLRWFGVISYEWYLFHQVIYIWIWRNLIGMANGDVYKYLGTIALSFAVSLLVSILIYRWFSLPILRFGRRRHAKSPHTQILVTSNNTTPV